MSMFSQESVHTVFWINSKISFIAVTFTIYYYVDIIIAFESNLLSLECLYLLIIISLSKWYPLSHFIFLLYNLLLTSLIIFLIYKNICLFEELYSFQYKFFDTLHLEFTVSFKDPNIIRIIWFSIIVCISSVGWIINIMDFNFKIFLSDFFFNWFIFYYGSAINLIFIFGFIFNIFNFNWCIIFFIIHGWFFFIFTKLDFRLFIFSLFCFIVFIFKVLLKYKDSHILDIFRLPCSWRFWCILLLLSLVCC